MVPQSTCLWDYCKITETAERDHQMALFSDPILELADPRSGVQLFSARGRFLINQALQWGVKAGSLGTKHTKPKPLNFIFYQFSRNSQILTCCPFRIKVPNHVRTFAFVPSSNPLTKHTRSLTPSSEDSFFVWSSVKATPRPGRWHSST